jgi:hypothetical protein
VECGFRFHEIGLVLSVGNIDFQSSFMFTTVQPFDAAFVRRLWPAKHGSAIVVSCILNLPVGQIRT